MTDKHTPGPWHLERGKIMARTVSLANVNGYNTTEGAANANILANALAMRDVLSEYVSLYPAFKTKPVGAPGSIARQEQEYLIALETTAKRLLQS